MKKNMMILLAVFSLVTVHAQELEKLWEVSGLEAPESVVFYNGNYLVSNVAGQPAEKNGKGYISLLNENGKILTQKWATGFNAPKGLGIHGTDLYVADIDTVAVVDLDTGKIKKTYHAEGATFLNDVEIAADGTVYITDTFGGNAIYRIQDQTISLWLKDERLNYPNGLKIKGKEILVSTWGVVTDPETFETEVPGVLLAVDLSSKAIKTITGPKGNFDGLVLWGDAFLVSDWIAGGLLTIDKNGNVKEIKDLNAGSADINFLKEKGV
ncbi:MAG: ATP/GTP-binding protein, partial [Bacteroidota bacterium]